MIVHYSKATFNIETVKEYADKFNGVISENEIFYTVTTKNERNERND